MLRINAQVKYLLLVTRFFTDAMTSPEAAHHVPAAAATRASQLRGVSTSVTQESLRSAASAHASRRQQTTTDRAAPPPLASSEGSLTVSGSFRQPEIVLFADPTQRNSRALVLKVSDVSRVFVFLRVHKPKKIRTAAANTPALAIHRMMYKCFLLNSGRS